MNNAGEHRQLTFWEDGPSSTKPSAEEAAAQPVLKDASPERQPSKPASAEELQRALAARTGREIHLTITRNRRRMASYRQGPVKKALTVRLHQMFLEAPEEVVDAAAAWLVNEQTPETQRLFRSFIDRSTPFAEAGPVIIGAAKGRAHDLQAMFDELNAEYFDGQIRTHIGWGRFGAPHRSARKRRIIQLGCWSERANAIRIHPALDRAEAPAFFVRAVVYHEMLHAHLGVERDAAGRRRMHTPQFRAMEQAYPDYERARKWQETHMDQLMKWRAMR